MQETKTCMECGQTKKCYTGRFAKLQRVYRIYDQNYAGADPSTIITCSLCDDCIGKVPIGTYSWVWLALITSLLMYVYGLYDIATARGSDMPIGLPLVGVAWLINMISTCAGLSKLWETEGEAKKATRVLLFSALLGWTQIPTLILLFGSKRMRRNVWIEKRLTEKAKRIIEAKQEELEGLIQRAQETDEKDTLTQEQKRQVSEVQEQDRRTQELAKFTQAKELKSNYRSAIIGIVITVVFAVAGFYTYSDGGQIEWLGIRLSGGGFAALMGAFFVYDIIALISARKKKEPLDEVAPAAQDTLSDIPPLAAACNVSITRLPSMMGCAMRVYVFLNGAEIGVLKNGSTLTAQTTRTKNDLTVNYAADNTTRSVFFEAKPNGNVNITLKYTGGVLTVAEDTSPMPTTPTGL